MSARFCKTEEQKNAPIEGTSKRRRRYWGSGSATITETLGVPGKYLQRNLSALSQAQNEWYVKMKPYFLSLGSLVRVDILLFGIRTVVTGRDTLNASLSNFRISRILVACSGVMSEGTTRLSGCTDVFETFGAPFVFEGRGERTEEGPASAKVFVLMALRNRVELGSIAL